METVQALRDRDFNRIDLDELINEIGSIASGLRREMVSLLKNIIEALLILTYADSDKAEAERQLAHARGQLQLLLHSAPALHDVVRDVIGKAYQRAKDNVTEDYGLSLPDTCPFTLDGITENP